MPEICRRNKVNDMYGLNTPHAHTQRMMVRLNIKMLYPTYVAVWQGVLECERTNEEQFRTMDISFQRRILRKANTPGRNITNAYTKERFHKSHYQRTKRRKHLSRKLERCNIKKSNKYKRFNKILYRHNEGVDTFTIST